jgi:ABC-type multidrug transport system ATPase subunit
LADADLLILDEPTNGLDPQGIREIRELILELQSKGTTIFLSSHLLAEVEQMCTRVGVLDRGRLVLQDDLDALRQPTGRTVVRTPDAAQAVALLNGRVELRDGDRLVVRGSDAASLNATLVGRGVRVTELSAERRTLEEVVVAATSPESAR